MAIAKIVAAQFSRKRGHPNADFGEMKGTSSNFWMHLRSRLQSTADLIAILVCSRPS
jgi:hypothetical protein